jgi:hypothetical protein
MLFHFCMLPFYDFLPQTRQRFPVFAFGFRPWAFSLQLEACSLKLAARSLQRQAPVYYLHLPTLHIINL